jgi:hypothetical protein
VTSEKVEQQRSRPWRTPQTLIAVVVAVAIGGLGGAAIYAATDGSPGTMAGNSRGPGGPMHGPPPQASGRSPADQAGPAVLHSEYVVADGRGSFTTKMTQTGTVDEVTLSSIVVRSDDGYTQMYAFLSAAVVPNRSVVANDIVTVEATRTGPTVTLNSIGEGPPHGI